MSNPNIKQVPYLQNGPGVHLQGNTDGSYGSLQITQIVIVAPSIDFTGTEAGKTELCFGDSTTLFGVAESTQLEDCAPEIYEETWLEDTQSTGQQASYESTISVECYADGLEFLLFFLCKFNSTPNN